MSSPFSQLRAYQRYMRWQGYQATPIEQFGGLDLINDPSEVGWGGAIDMMDVDLTTSPGVLKTRPGTTSFASPASAADVRLIPSYAGTLGTTHLLSSSDIGGSKYNLVVYNTSAGVVTSDTTLDSPVSGYASLAMPTQNPVLYMVGYPQLKFSGGGKNAAEWDGSVLTFTAGPPSGRCVAVQQPDNRLVWAGVQGEESRVWFSDPGAPTTFTVNNVVDLLPGESGGINALASWGNLLFAFKSGIFFVFYGNSTDTTGNPIFNYRAVAQGIGGIAACTAPDGVYFLDPVRGIYKTTGGTAQKVSGPLDPLWTGTTSSFWTGSTLDLNLTKVFASTMTYHDKRLYISIHTSPARTLVYDIPRDRWSIWSNGGTSIVSWYKDRRNAQPTLFVDRTTAIHRISSASTTDAGSSFNARYRSGFGYPAGGGESRIREAILQGTGTVTVKGSTDWGALNAGESVTMGTAPAIAEGRVRGSSFRGRNFSWQVSGTGAWSIERLVLMLAGARDQVEQ